MRLDIYHPFSQIFIRQFYSYRFGQIKSEPFTCTKTLQAMQKTPDQCLFIDESAINIIVANEAGIRGIRFVNATDLTEKLPALAALTIR